MAMMPFGVLKNMFTYLTEYQKKEIERIQDMRQGKLDHVPELVLSVCNFDHFYYYSDSMVVYNNQERKAKELTAQINEIEDEVLKAALKKGMTGDLTSLDELFPQRKLARYVKEDPSDIRVFALKSFTQGEFSTLVNYLADLTYAFLEELKTQSSELDNHFGLIYTPYAPHPKTLEGKRSVSEITQKIINKKTTSFIHTLFEKVPDYLAAIKLTEKIDLVMMQTNPDGSRHFILKREDQRVTFTLFL